MTWFCDLTSEALWTSSSNKWPILHSDRQVGLCSINPLSLTVSLKKREVILGYTTDSPSKSSLEATFLQLPGIWATCLFLVLHSDSPDLPSHTVLGWIKFQSTLLLLCVIWLGSEVPGKSCFLVSFQSTFLWISSLQSSLVSILPQSPFLFPKHHPVQQ